MDLLRNLLIGMTLGLCLPGCEADSTVYPVPESSPDDVLVVVEEYLVDQGTKLDDYEINLIGFDYVDRSWRVGFDGKSNIIGDHFWVIVSDEDTSQISLQPGL